MVKKKTAFVTKAAIIAVMYILLTYLSMIFGLASGAVQCRLSEALCVLPVFTAAAVPGLFVGCIISNFLSGCIITDIVFGSLATLIGAVGTYILRKKNKWLFPVPTIISNTLIIPLVLKFAYGLDEAYLYFVATIFVGEIISCGLLGVTLYNSLEKHKKVLFK